VAASARRLRYVIELTPFDDGMLADGLRDLAGAVHPGALDAALAGFPDSDWERSLTEALQRPEADARAAMLGESMTELDFRTRRWARVPRVAASLSSSCGFLLATFGLRIGLSSLLGGSAATSADVVVDGAVLDAIDAVALGLAGAAMCSAVQRAAREALSRRLAGALRLADRLERLADGVALPLADGTAHVTVPAESGGSVPTVA